MPELKFYCALCGTTITGNESFYGSEFSCPSCNARVLIPRPDTTGAGASAPAQPASPAHAVPPASLPEQPVATFAPVFRAYSGRLFLMFICLLAALACIVFLWNQRPWGWYAASAFALVALILLLATLWRCKSVRYELSTQRLTIISGLLSKHIDELELFRVKDVLVSQSIWQRMLNYGSITVLSTDDTTPRLIIANIRAPLQAKELLRDAYRAARSASGLRTTEFIQS